MVARVYAEGVGSAPLLSWPRAYKIQAIASSVAFQNAAPIFDILQAAYWKLVNLFVEFYLGDLLCTR